MIGAVDTGPAEPRRFVALAIDALQGIGWVQVRRAMLFGIAVTVFHVATLNSVLLTLSKFVPLTLAKLILGAALSFQVKSLCLLAAIVVADRAADEGAPRRIVYFAAALVGCVAGVALSEPLDLAWRAWVLPADIWPVDRPWFHGTAKYFHFPFYALTYWLLIGGSAVFLYGDRRAARQTEARLRSAELDRTRSSRLAFESRLQAMQARIEPQFLFNTLAQVERLHEDDPAQAGNMLDALISYLRAAMPMMRDTSSTVGREIELARAYLDIVRLRLGERLSVAIEAPPGADDIRMPPMMLLPLIDHAIVRGLEPATGASAGAGAISIHTDVRDGRLRLLIRDSGVGFAPETGGDGIAALRERLDALYGSSARLELRRADPRATEAVLDLPLESSASADAHTASSFPEAAP